jgi:glyoxylase-like metal-dependent hydrolase (beta-lactamase superfamily II)
MMASLDRRTLLAGATALATSAITLGKTATPLHAAAPMSGKQAPGYYRYKVGDFEITAVTDGVRPSPLTDGFVRNQSKEAVSNALASIYPGQNKEQPVFPFTPVVVNTGSRLVVIDTGVGPAVFAQSKGALGQFHTNLEAAGIDRNAVDIVIISHFHGDHIGGLLTVDNKPAFPNAEVMVPGAEWAHWMDDAKMNAAPETARGGFQNVRRVFGALGKQVTRYDTGKEIAPGITAIASPGHTPGHTSHVVASGSDRVLVQADITAGSALLFVRNPGWHAAFDADGALAEQTRRRLYDMAIAEKMLVQGFHFPFPAAGYVEKDGDGYRLTPIAWNAVL